MPLDVDFVRSQFPAFSDPSLHDWSFFENAGGSYACSDTISALTNYYTTMKVQPYAPYPASAEAGSEMDRAHQRWAQVLGVKTDEVMFGPSTSANTYVLAQTFGQLLGPGDEVIVTNQDHEANTGAIRRSAEAAGASLVEWRIDPSTGLLDGRDLERLLSSRTALVTFPHCSNIIGQENDVKSFCALAKQAGARTIVDGVSFAPHSLPNVADLGPDVYLFSLYKVFSVHQGLMVIRQSLMDELPNQAHSFNNQIVAKRMNPAGPDHAQVASANGVLDYIERLDAHHDSTASGNLGDAARRVSALWREHEDTLLAPVLRFLEDQTDVRVLGPTTLDAGHHGAHRCPTVAFVPATIEPAAIAERLAADNVMASAGHFYATRVLDGLGVDPDRGVVRLSWVHYTNQHDIDRLLRSLTSILAA